MSVGRLENLFKSRAGKLLSIFLMPGYPRLESTVPTAKALIEEGVDFLEIGMPFSDPLADGPVIQQAGQRSLQNGMNLSRLLEDVAEIREHSEIPLVLMGYANPLFQYGIEAFFARCEEIGVDACILPDVPLEEYRRHFAAAMKKHHQRIIFLVSSVTPLERVRELDAESGGFLYVVSSPSVTGTSSAVGQMNTGFIREVSELGLQNPLMVGFGIRDAATFSRATEFARGGIVGSAFLEAMKESTGKEREIVKTFVLSIRNG